MSLISGNAIFGSDAVNCSSNSISGLAVFLDTAINNGSVTSAVFSDGAVNCGSLTSGTFLGTAINSGSVNIAEFFGTASNAGFVVESAKFADTSSNVGTVSGSAIFTDTSISDGVVEGAVQLGVNVTEGENQALTETPTEYTQTDGFFPNAHYSSGSKTAPTDYETVVHQVGGFWYKYDGNGDGSLASGNYSDGTSMFTFVNGIKGPAYDPGYPADGTYIRTETNYYEYFGQNYANGTVEIVADGNGGERNGTISYAPNGTMLVSNISNANININGSIYPNGHTSRYSDGVGGVYDQDEYAAQGTVFTTVNLPNININGTDYSNGTKSYVSDGSGSYTEVDSYPAQGTVFTSVSIDININGNNYNNGTKDYVSDGLGGYSEVDNYPQEGTELYNDATYSYQADGSGGYTSVSI